MISEKEYVQLSEKDLRKVLQKAGLSRHADSFVQRRDAYVVAERTRALRRFRSYQICPRCLVRDFHLMKKGIRRKKCVVRVCSDCEYEWEQE